MPNNPNVCSIIGEDPLNEYRCAGHRKDGMFCNNRVAVASRYSAYSILQECEGLRSSSDDLLKNFEAAARLLLCKRWHQYQSNAVVSRWLRAWKANEEMERERRRRRRNRERGSRDLDSQSSTRSDRSTSIDRSPVLLVLGISQNTRTLTSDIARDRQPSNRSSGHSPATSRTSNATSTSHTIRRHSEPSSRNASSTADTNSRPRRESSEPVTRTRAATASSTPPRTVQVPRSTERSTQSLTSSPRLQSSPIRPQDNSQQSPPSRSDHQHNRAPSPSQSRTSTSNTSLPRDVSGSPTPSTVQRDTQPQDSTRRERTSDAECPVCMLPYDSDDFVECHQCQNRVHVECQELWDSHRRPAPATCVYCRTHL